AVARRVVRRPDLRYAALVPNRAGLDRALATGVREIALFMSATETHNLKNTNKTIAQSLAHFAEILPVAKQHGVFVRAYLSTIWGCPYEGKVDPARALEIARQLRAMGCDELCLGDMGIETGIDLVKLIEAGALAQELVGHKLAGRRLQAALGRRQPGEARIAEAT